MRAVDFELNFERGSPEHKAAAARDWQDNGPILRNRDAGQVHSHYWTLLETIVWVATRDERAVAGAAGALRDHQANDRQPDFGTPTRIILSTDLRIDVAGHHLDCPAMWEPACCECATLGRRRYCVCSDEEQRSRDWLCPCTDNAIRAVGTAILDGLPVSGKPEGRAAWQAIEFPALAGARRWFDTTGLRFVPGFTDMRLRIEVVKERWPAGFIELPARNPGKTQQQTLLDRLADANPVGRPADNIVGLAIFLDRLAAGRTAQSRVAEGKAIHDVFPPNDRGVVPQEKTIREWIGPHHDLVALAPDRASGLEAAQESALHTMMAKVDEKTAGRKR